MKEGSSMSSTLKKDLILSYAYLTESKSFDLDKNSILLLTPFGIISGKLLDRDVKYTDNALIVLNEINKQTSDKYLEEHEFISDNDGYIPLKDVTITCPNKSVFNMTSLNVFYDQVIGITMGNLSSIDDDFVSE